MSITDEFNFGPRNADEAAIFAQEAARVDREVEEYQKTLRCRIMKRLSGRNRERYEVVEQWIHRRITSVRFLYQRLTRGWDDSACWSLDDHLAELILPRLKRFKELNVHAWPGPGNGVETFEDWQEILDKMIFAFEWDCDEDRKYGGWDAEEYEQVKEGHLLFGKFFNALWD